ncbi:hypothetical protein QA639_21190 [Bradyrhizobium pachyrhizi]|uniref:hypothetical protein n=1 Tax=Bradyrhizobium pachyrhizi TaxID=280333 RepID=UPI0024B1AA35|nr:hypothetical protein [Bradyrhizobium pachyrhizi]WFU52225.1 hypothetical protein QA639_21190 [Bradyrhizobium pachyrhizi]
MIPSVITDTSITFIARGRPWTLAADHTHYEKVKELLTSGSDDSDEIVRLADVRIAVEEHSGGVATLTEDGLYLDGEQLPQAWLYKACAEPNAAKVLAVAPGDRVRVEGDEDAPDGIYSVGEVDNSDVDKRVYVEPVDNDEDYFGFVANTSIKEIIKEAADA